MICYLLRVMEKPFMLQSITKCQIDMLSLHLRQIENRISYHHISISKGLILPPTPHPQRVLLTSRLTIQSSIQDACRAYLGREFHPIILYTPNRGTQNFITKIHKAYHVHVQMFQPSIQNIQQYIYP